MRILGIDPGTGRTGWGVLDKNGGKERMVAYGCFETKANSELVERLELIYKRIGELIDEYKPDEIAVEDLFFATNAKTAMSVGQARGVVLLAGRHKKLPIYSYTPLQVKSAVTGYGKADKKQVELMVVRILGLKETPKPDDAADALAVALTHGSVNSRLKA